MVQFTRGARVFVTVAVLGCGAAVPGVASAAPSKLMGMLPEGFSSSNCEAQTSTGLAVEKVNCDQSTVAGGPTAASFALYRNVDDLASGFSSAKIDLASSCPGDQQSPGPWTSQGQVGGQVECGTVAGANGKVSVVAWSDNAKLRAAAVQGNDISSLYQWWKTKSG